MEITLRRLQHYIALAEEKSFLKAADRVHLSQPALSRSIQSLEADLGIVLIDRAARQFSLTAAGKRILDRARRVSFETRGLQRDADLIRNHALGEVAFGIGSMTAAICLGEVLKRMSASHPGLQLRADVNSWSVLWDRLHRESIDFFVLDRRTIPRSDTIVMERLTAHPAGWHVGKEHPLSKKRKLDTDDLHGYAFAFVPLPDSIRQFVRRRLNIGTGQDIDCIVECNDFSALKSLAAASGVILFATDSAVSAEVANGTLTKLQIADMPAIEVEMAIAYLAHRTLSPQARIAIDIIAEVFESALGRDE